MPIPSIHVKDWGNSLRSQAITYLSSFASDEIIMDITVQGAFAQGYPDDTSDIDVFIWVNRSVSELIPGYNRERPTALQGTPENMPPMPEYEGRKLDIWLRSYSEFDEKLLYRGYSISCYSLMTGTLYTGEDDSSFRVWKESSQRPSGST